MDIEKFIIKDYDATYAQKQFQKLKEKLEQIVSVKIDVQHVGATSIPNTITKGDIDCCVRVEKEHFDLCDSILSKHFTRNHSSVRNDFFSSFIEAENNIGIQLVISESDLDVFTAFRDILKQHPKILEEYNDLKMSYNEKSMDDYRNAKDAFINKILALNSKS